MSPPRQHNPVIEFEDKTVIDLDQPGYVTVNGITLQWMGARHTVTARPGIIYVCNVIAPPGMKHERLRDLYGGDYHGGKIVGVEAYASNLVINPIGVLVRIPDENGVVGDG